MAVIVQKYGGSSVADVERLEAVADKVAATRRAGSQVVVVISAMGGTTDELLRLAHRIDPSPPRRELDMLVSTGERVSMALLSMAIQKRGQDAISFTGSQSGLITNHRHFDASIIEVRPFRIEDELAQGRVVIVAGYQGMSYKREITTLGRGGSDTTAIALAAALGAEHAEIYSDVDGVYSADPRVVPDAEHLPELSYDEMSEMSTAGAKVLHAQAVAYARDHRIAIHARSTFQEGRQTVIDDGERRAARPAVVGRGGVAELSVSGGSDDVAAALRDVREAGATVIGTRLRDGASAILLAADMPDWEDVRTQLARTHAVVEGLGLVTVVGRSEKAAPVGPCLAALGATPRDVTTDGPRLRFVLDGTALDEAVRSVHRALGGD